MLFFSFFITFLFLFSFFITETWGDVVVKVSSQKKIKIKWKGGVLLRIENRKRKKKKKKANEDLGKSLL